MFDHRYPYTDAHELNLDWIIRMIKKLNHDMSDFEAINHIKWGGLHDTGKEYAPWTIVDTPEP